MCSRAEHLVFSFRPLAFPISATFAPKRPLTPGSKLGLERTCLQKSPSQARRISFLQTITLDCARIEPGESLKQRANVPRTALTLASPNQSQYSHRQPILYSCRNSQRVTCDNWRNRYGHPFRSFNTFSRASLLRREGIVGKEEFEQRISVLTMAKESRQVTLGYVKSPQLTMWCV